MYHKSEWLYFELFWGENKLTLLHKLHTDDFSLCQSDHFVSVVPWRNILKYLQKYEGCTHFYDTLYIYIYIYIYIRMALCPIQTKSLGNYYITSDGVMVSKLDFVNLHDWVRVSLGAPFIQPCATSKKKKLTKFDTIDFILYSNALNELLSLSSGV